MPKIRDRAIICWTDQNGKHVNEEVVTYELDEEDEEEEEVVSKRSSSINFEHLYEENTIIDKFMLTFTLENLLDEIEILKCTTQGEHAPLQLQYPEYYTLDERYGKLIQFNEDQESDSMKRYADLNMIHSVVFKTLEEVKISGSYAPLAEATRLIKKMTEDDERLIREDEETRIEEEDLKKQLLTQNKELETRNAAILDELRRLELALEEAIAYGKLEYKYLVKWEEARRHQAMVMQEREENNYRDIISTNRTKIELENRIHGELVRFFEENAEDLNNETSYWMYRYENEIESREGELLKLRMDREAQMEKHLQLKATYETQKEFNDYWGGVKEARRLAEELLELQHLAASTIQRWWRRTMKRLHLGPYKKGKKGKKGKAEKVKKGGKKK